MRFTAKQPDLGRVLARVLPFTDPSSSTAPHTAALLLDADAATGTLTITAESQCCAVQLVADANRFGVQVERSGRVLVQAEALRRAAQLARSSDLVQVDCPGTFWPVRVRAGNLSVEVQPMPLVRLPTTGGAPSRARQPRPALPSLAAGSEVPGPTTGVVLRTEDFVRGFEVGGVAYDREGNVPLLTGVHAAVVPTGLRFTSLDRLCAVYCTVPIAQDLTAQSAVAPPWQVLLEPGSTRRMLPLLLDGETLQVETVPDDRVVYLRIEDAQGQLLYHLRAETRRVHAPRDYPAEKLAEFIVQKYQLTGELAVDQDELLRLLAAASRFKDLHNDPWLTVRPSRLQVRLRTPRRPHDGQVGFRGSVPAQLVGWPGPLLEFGLRYSLYSRMLRGYPEHTLRATPMVKPGRQQPSAIGLFTRASGWHPGVPGLPDDYFAVIPLVDDKPFADTSGLARLEVLQGEAETSSDVPGDDEPTAQAANAVLADTADDANEELKQQVLDDPTPDLDSDPSPQPQRRRSSRKRVTSSATAEA